MAKITLKGNPVNTHGELPAIGKPAPNFTLTAKDLKDLDLTSFAGQKVILNIVPSLDTPTCATSTRKFNEQAASLDNTKILVISADLPFAQGRFCTTEGLDNVIPLSTFRSSFAKDYGILITDGPLAGLTARAVLVIDETGKVVYSELVSEIAQEPDYAGALNALG